VLLSFRDAGLTVYGPLAPPHFVAPFNTGKRRRHLKFNRDWECAGLTDDDLRVEVPSDQRRSGQVGTESCEPAGDVRFEA
jgi:hypothetical protein